MQQDALQIKERMVSFLRTHGPSLPVHVSSHLGMSMLFTSAFLSELYAEKIIKMSHMRVGSSPIYFIPEHEPQIEKYSQHLKSKEKEAFFVLKEKKFLKDTEQEPAIRVALRSIRDFAIPFRFKDEIYWRYLNFPESEFHEDKKEKPISIIEKIQEKKEIPEIRHEIKKEPILNIFDEDEDEEKSIEVLTNSPRGGRAISREENSEGKNKNPSEVGSWVGEGGGLEKKEISRTSPKKKSQKKNSKKEKTNEKLFNSVKDYLTNNSYEISDIVNFNKEELNLIVKKDGEPLFISAFNKKIISDKDFIKSYKKASEMNMKHLVLSKGEPSKKMNDFIDAIKNLSKLEGLDN